MGISILQYNFLRISFWKSHSPKMAMKMKASMKMKAKKATAMKMKMKAKKVSKVGKKWRVFAGIKEKTKGGLKKGDLTKNKNGKVVSKKASANGKKAFKRIAKWNAAV